MSQKYFSNRITINEIKDDIGIIGNSDPTISRLEKPGIQRLGNSAIVKVNRREMEGFIDRYDNDKKGFGTFNKYNSNPNSSLNPTKRTLHYRDPADPIDSTLPDTNYKCFDGLDKPSKGQIVVVENPYFKDKVTGDIRITDGGLTHAGVTFPPVGTFGYFAYDNAVDPPDGWIECAGQAVVYQRKKNNTYYETEYTRLYNIIDSWGIFTKFSDIRPTATEGKVFIMPDLRGYFVRGLNIDTTGLDNNSLKDKQPYFLHKNSDVIDHVHTGENPYSRVEKIEAEIPDRSTNQEVIWNRRPNRTTHRSAPYGEWITTKTQTQLDNQQNLATSSNYYGDSYSFAGLPWLPEESNGYSNVYHGNGGGKFSNYAETNGWTYGWGTKRYSTEMYSPVAWNIIKGGPPGLGRYSGINGMTNYDNSTTSDHAYNTYAKGNGSGTQYRHVHCDTWSSSDFWGDFDHLYHYPFPWHYFNFSGSYHDQSIGGNSTYDYYGYAWYNWAVGEHDDPALPGVNFKYENEVSYYWERKGGNDPHASNSWHNTPVFRYRQHSWHTYYDRYHGDYFSSHRQNYDHYHWNPANGGSIHNEAHFGYVAGDSEVGWANRHNFIRNPWIRSFDRHMHGNVFTYYRSMEFPDPRPNHMGEWHTTSYGGQYKHRTSGVDHLNCNQNITRRNEIHWSRLRAMGGCWFASGTAGNQPTSDPVSGMITDMNTPDPNLSRGWTTHMNNRAESMYNSGFGGLTRRRYNAWHKSFGMPWDNDSYMNNTANFCFITKPQEGETGLLNSGDDGDYTSIDGDHAHEIFGAHNGVFYQGQEETRPHNIALRFFIKY
jgi:hypothetical protein